MKKVLLALSLTLGINNASIASGIPVIDGVSLVEAVLQSGTQLDVLAQQLQEYQLQIRQYESQMQNLASIPQQLWDDVNGVVREFQATTNMLNRIKDQYGSLDVILDKFKVDMTAHPCFIGACSVADKSEYAKNIQLMNDFEESLYDGILDGVLAQQKSIGQDAEALEKLQRNATGVNGALSAQQATNQINSQQNHQMLQLRQAQSAQAQAEAIREKRRMHEDAERKARENMSSSPIVRGESRQGKGFSFNF